MILIIPFHPIGGLQPISRDTDNNAAMYNCWGKTKGANQKSFVFVHQHGGYDVTWKPPIVPFGWSGMVLSYLSKSQSYSLAKSGNYTNVCMPRGGGKLAPARKISRLFAILKRCDSQTCSFYQFWGALSRSVDRLWPPGENQNCWRVSATRLDSLRRKSVLV